MTPTPTSKLTQTLLPEVFQTEKSAVEHPTREAKRLGETTPPALAMLAIASHASEALRHFNALAEARGRVAAKKAAIVGKLFSVLRELGTDLVLSSEKSYRGTLLGARHGIGVITLLRAAALTSGDGELAEYCSTWLRTRTRLVENAESALAWFALHQDVALSRAQRQYNPA